MRELESLVYITLSLYLTAFSNIITYQISKKLFVISD